jgi:hypothetical protein
MPSFTEIGQMALSHLGSGKTMSDIETDTSEEGRALRTFQETALKKTLAAAPWPFCTDIVDLTLVEENPNDAWDFSYTYPSTIVMIQKILNGAKGAIDTRDTRVPFQIAKGSSSKVVWTNEDDAQALVTEYVTDTSFFTPSFIIAFSYYWAYLVAPRITKSNPQQIKKEMLVYFKQEVAEAVSQSFNEEQQDVEPDSEFIRSRE